MPQIDIDGANSKISADKIQGQSGTTVTVPTGHTVAITDADRLTIAGTAVKAGALGKIVQVVNGTSAAIANGTTIIPKDDTIPQNTEGVEFMTQAITPTNASNKLLIVHEGRYALSISTAQFAVCLFQDSNANSLVSNMFIERGSDNITHGGFTHYMTAGTTSSTTFKVRAGSTANAATIYWNSNSGGRHYGATCVGTLTIMEIAV